MKILVIWRLLTVGGVNAGWRNRAIHFKKYGIETEFLYSKDLGGLHIMSDIANVYLTKNKQEINEIIQSNYYDAIIIVDTKDAYQWIIQANYTGPIIIEARTPEILKLKPHIERIHDVKPKVIVVPSEHQKRLVSILIDKIPIKVINNGIDTSFFQPLSSYSTEQEPFLPENKKVIGWIGRVDKRKNWRLFLKIAQRILKERDDLEFWLIGGAKSVQKEKFTAQWQALDLTKNIKWFPVIPYQQMPEVYSKIRISGDVRLQQQKESHLETPLSKQWRAAFQ
ncbi:glycosyltransferase [Halalkalibacter krulwichiae]|uniref:D-inositol-3-phosphate glycosyltransferase n=1 Tax=Halalkalibacter krulwichiae TaxID=199441 RepID=A0A1X9MGZ9_9BACI|nr:glycosyltransferase [Halalkalibacter krulwichiae]ARK29712.1 D-inositol-3-phosphate glycosyltransferase [Halalkalibacter krulwichiae]